MATLTNTTHTSRFHNLSNAAVADELGRVHSVVKASEAELKLLKDEFKSRGLQEAAGDAFAVTATEQISSPTYARFATAIVSTVIRIKAANRTLAVAA